LNADLDHTPRTIEYSILISKVKHQVFLERTENFSNLFKTFFFLIVKFQILYWTDTLNK